MAGSALILLNGTSSSGKTSIAQALQEISDRPYLRFSSDILEEYVHRRFTDPWEAKQAFLPALLQGHFHCMGALARTGNWVVADAVLEEPVLVDEAVRALWDQRAFLVGVHCPAEELERRERQRGDRAIGMAVGQLERVHAHGVYDFAVDTSVASPLECARRIAEFAEGASPRAFAELKAARGVDPAEARFELDWW